MFGRRFDNFKSGSGRVVSEPFFGVNQFRAIAKDKDGHPRLMGFAAAHQEIPSKGDNRKFAPQSHPLAREDAKKTMEAHDRVTEKYINNQVSLQEQEAADLYEPSAGGATRGQQQALAANIALEHQKRKGWQKRAKQAADQQFARNFVNWLMGQGTEEEYKRAFPGIDPKMWREQRRLVSKDPSVLQFLRQWQNRVIDYQEELTKMRSRLGRGEMGKMNINDAWKYYKFVVCGMPFDPEEKGPMDLAAPPDLGDRYGSKTKQIYRTANEHKGDEPPTTDDKNKVQRILPDDQSRDFQGETFEDDIQNRPALDLEDASATNSEPIYKEEPYDNLDDYWTDYLIGGMNEVDAVLNAQFTDRGLRQEQRKKIRARIAERISGANVVPPKQEPIQPRVTAFLEKRREAKRTKQAAAPPTAPPPEPMKQLATVPKEAVVTPPEPETIEMTESVQPQPPPPNISKVKEAELSQQNEALKKQIEELSQQNEALKKQSAEQEVSFRTQAEEYVKNVQGQVQGIVTSESAKGAETIQQIQSAYEADRQKILADVARMHAMNEDEKNRLSAEIISSIEQQKLLQQKIAEQEKEYRRQKIVSAPNKPAEKRKEEGEEREKSAKKQKPEELIGEKRKKREEEGPPKKKYSEAKPEAKPKAAKVMTKNTRKFINALKSVPKDGEPATIPTEDMRDILHELVYGAAKHEITEEERAQLKFWYGDEIEDIGRDSPYAKKKYHPLTSKVVDTIRSFHHLFAGYSASPADVMQTLYYDKSIPGLDTNVIHTIQHSDSLKVMFKNWQEVWRKSKASEVDEKGRNDARADERHWASNFLNEVERLTGEYNKKHVK